MTRVQAGTPWVPAQRPDLATTRPWRRWCQQREWCVSAPDCLNLAIPPASLRALNSSHPPPAAQVDQHGNLDLQWVAWIGEPEATRSRMIVDNLLGRGADHLDASESSVDNIAFRGALLEGWQRLEAVVERNYRLEHFVVIHLHWAPVVAVCALARVPFAVCNLSRTLHEPELCVSRRSSGGSLVRLT